MHNKLLLALALALLLLLVLPGTVSHATPSPPYVLVNESTHECYVSIMNDECFWCDPPPGWKIYGPGDPGYGNTECPAGFHKIDHLALDCKRYKTPFCCGGSSAHGDCADMLVNATQQACAFVEDVRACAIPDSWSARPTDVPESIWSCTYQYHWVGDLPCLAATPTPAGMMTVALPIQCSRSAPLVGILLIMVGGALFVWFGRKRNRP